MAEFVLSDIARLGSAIEGADRPVIVTHAKPDGDAMGSSIAMLHFLFSKGKKAARIVLSDPWPHYLSFIMSEEAGRATIVHSESPEVAVSAISESDLIICLDFNAFHRTDKLEKPLAESDAAKVLIDHHLNPDRESFDICFSEAAVSSASELLYSILMRTDEIAGDASRLPAESADALMTGMTTDTNNFANSVYPSTLMMASELIAAGVDRDRIISGIYNQYRENRIRLMGLVLKDLLHVTEYGVAYVVLDKKTLEEYDIEEGETEGFVNIPLSMAKVRMSLLLKEEGDKARVSIRSKKGTSANRCARLYFNGGGHENAAGGRLYIPGDIRDIEEAASYIEKHTFKFLTEENE